jgi:hypothetical protein
MKKVLWASLILSLAFVFTLAFPTAEADKFPFQGDYETYYRDVDDDEMVGILIKYVGSEENGQVDGNATGDVLLLDGDLGSEAADADATSNCGAVAGTFDVSDADCDTFGELMVEINATSNWIATLVDVPPWGDAGASALILLDPGSAQNAKTDSGYAMLVDSSAIDDTFVALLPNSRYGANDMRTYTKGIPGAHLLYFRRCGRRDLDVGVRDR